MRSKTLLVTATLAALAGCASGLVGREASSPKAPPYALASPEPASSPPAESERQLVLLDEKPGEPWPTPAKPAPAPQPGDFAGAESIEADAPLTADARERLADRSTAAPAARHARKTDPRPDPRRDERRSPPRFTRGTLLARDAEGRALGELPLRHTDVVGDVSGFLASTRVRQTFQNAFETPIEAVYVFPLPETAAVNDFIMTVGARRIRGLIRPRAEAQRIYADARARGYTASLLTQERPNVFTQSVANLAPGRDVEIEITYFQTLRYEAGEYEWVFPMVVGPRFIPGGTTLDGAPRVPDAARISPPVLAEGERSGHDVSVRVELEAGVPLREVVVPTHDCAIERTSDSHASVALRPADSIANRDFVLRWRVAGDAPAVGAITHRGDDGGFFSLLLQPQLRPADADVTPREVTFLIDVSGSQMGLPLEMSKNVVQACLDRLRPDDRFNVMYFESGNGELFEHPAANTPANVRAARQFVSSLSGGGGTNMLEGLQRALRAERDPRYLGMVVFFTDGYIGNDQEILRLVKEEHGATRVFVFGTGSSVNRSLLSGIAEHGDGKVEYALPRDVDYADRCVASFFKAIDSPVLCDITIDWGGLAVRDVYPTRVKDLFAGQPIALTGRYLHGGSSTIRVNGRVGARRVSYPLTLRLPELAPDHAALAPIWARARIGELTAMLPTASYQERQVIERDVTSLAVEFRLVSDYTAFVAVDRSAVVSDGAPVRVDQKVELPEGVSREGIFGGADR